MLNELKEKGFEEKHGCLIKETVEYTIVINPRNLNIRGYKDNVDFNRDQLENILKEMGLNREVMQRGMQYFLDYQSEDTHSLSVCTCNLGNLDTEVLPLEEMMDQAPYIDTDTLLSGVRVRFLTNPIRTGEWKGQYEGRAKFTIFVILLDEYPRLCRIDCGRNFLSYLRASSLIAGIRDLKGHEADIKREGFKQNTRYKIKFIKEETE